MADFAWASARSIPDWRCVASAMLERNAKYNLLLEIEREPSVAARFLDLSAQRSLFGSE